MDKFNYHAYFAEVKRTIENKNNPEETLQTETNEFLEVDNLKDENFNKT